MFAGYLQSYCTQHMRDKLEFMSFKNEFNTKVQIHTNPPLPDDVDEYGNLPSLRCGWKACGKVFPNKTELLEHVSFYKGGALLDRFHVNCKNVLENNPDLTLSEFEEKVKEVYPREFQPLVKHAEIKAYHNQFQQVFKKHRMEKDLAHQSTATKETAEMLFDFRIQSMKKLTEQNKIPEQFVSKELRQEFDRQVQIHTNPLLPDDVDEYGNLPSYRCGWKACGKVFQNKQELLDHVRLYRGTFLDRFHVNCKNILENNPGLTLSEFEERVRDVYPGKFHHLIQHSEIKVYYNEFQPKFKKHRMEKDLAHLSTANKETAAILFDYRIQSMKKLREQNKIPRQFTQNLK